jgi:hypothetical protein
MTLFVVIAWHQDFLTMTHSVGSKKLVTNDASTKHMSIWQQLNHYRETLTKLTKDFTYVNGMTLPP